MKKVFALGILLIASVGVVLTPAGVTAAADGLAPEGDQPRSRRDVSGIDEKLGAQLPLDLVLRDEEEQPVTLRDCIAGKPTILVPMYYRCPMLCNLVLKSLVETLHAMPQDFTAGKQFNVVAISFDPKEHSDLAAGKKKTVLKEYGREGAEQGWRFLTGSKEAIPEVMNAIGYRFEFDKSFKEYNHPSGIIVLTPEGKTARYFYGITYDGEFRVPGGTTTLRLSLIEAADGKGGTMLDKLTLLCYRFEHMKGYSLSVLRAVQIGGVMTLLAVGLWLLVTFRQEWRGPGNVAEAANEAQLKSARELAMNGSAESTGLHDGLSSGGPR